MVHPAVRLNPRLIEKTLGLLRPGRRGQAVYLADMLDGRRENGVPGGSRERLLGFDVLAPLVVVDPVEMPGGAGDDQALHPVSV